MASRFLFTNGVISQISDTPPVSSLLESHPAIASSTSFNHYEPSGSTGNEFEKCFFKQIQFICGQDFTVPGAYTTTRTHNNASTLLFWERHLQRLAESTRILFNSKPEFLFKSDKPMTSLLPLSVWDSVIQSLVHDSMNKAIPIVNCERKGSGELAITTLVCGNLEKLGGNENVDEERISQILDVYLHVGSYVPPVFSVRENCANLAVVGPGRDVAMAKYSDWVRLRKPLEKLRPDLVTELLLSNDGDQILEGCITNFFVVCHKDSREVEAKSLLDYGSMPSLEVQTAPLTDGVLPGIIRQLVIEVCSSMGIPFREVAPSWSKRDLWEDAFITNSLRVMQHVETIQAPSSWEQLKLNNWKEVLWEEKRFKDGPGMITAAIQKEIMKRASFEGFPVTNFI